tara:strand:+ start:710 stop:985 length:276 start_codon:yes stop_codon:yes gene_type:complete
VHSRLAGRELDITPEMMEEMEVRDIEDLLAQGSISGREATVINAGEGSRIMIKQCSNGNGKGDGNGNGSFLASNGETPDERETRNWWEMAV